MAQKRLRELQAAIKLDKDTQAAAVANNNATEHKNATVALAFHQAQLEAAQEDAALPPITNEEMEMLAIELAQSRVNELVPIITRMQKNRKEAAALFAKYEEVEKNCKLACSAAASIPGSQVLRYASINPTIKALFASCWEDSSFDRFAATIINAAIKE